MFSCGEIDGDCGGRECGTRSCVRRGIIRVADDGVIVFAKRRGRTTKFNVGIRVRGGFIRDVFFGDLHCGDFGVVLSFETDDFGDGDEPGGTFVHQ